MRDQDSYILRCTQGSIHLSTHLHYNCNRNAYAVGLCLDCLIAPAMTFE